MSETEAQGLKATERIRRRTDFKRIYAVGQRLGGRFMTVFLLPNDLGTSRLGVAATRKLGNAVERNRAKRLAREIFRRAKPATAQDVVIVPRRKMLDASFPHLDADYCALISRPGSHGSRAVPQRPGADRARPASRL